MAIVFECDRCKARFNVAAMDERQEIHKLSLDADKDPARSRYRWLLCETCLTKVQDWIDDGNKTAMETVPSALGLCY